MKLRFSSLDVKIIAHELSKTICTLRLSNIFDLSSRIFLFKFAKPNHREQIIIDSGFRCHLTKYSRATAAAPSGFVTRLRKFLKTRRVTSVSQVGTDRIIELHFSDGQYRLFFEFYAGGNVILTDRELNVLTLLRTVGEGEGQEELRVGLKYSLESRQNYGGVPPLTKERVRDGLQRALDRTSEVAAGPVKKMKRKPGDALRQALATTLTEFPPMLLDHAFLVAEFNPTIPVEDVVKDDSTLDKLMCVLKEANSVVSRIMATETPSGYIIAKTMKGASDRAADQTAELSNNAGTDEILKYEDFHPFRPRNAEGAADTKIIEIIGFNATVDEFFSSIEAQKLESRLTEREEHAKKKLDAARLDHQKRVGGLQEVQELNVRKAEAIEANLQRVQEVILAVNSLIAQGMDWVELARLIEMEQARHNSVAEMIKLPLKLYENTATLLLAEADYEEDEVFDGDETGSDVSESDEEMQKPSELSKKAKSVDKRLAVDVDLALSPWANAREYYDQKKYAAVKEQKTLQSSAMALKSTERKVNADLKKGLKQEKEVLRPVRKQMWFEKFYYFISSDGYLVLAGRDAQQNEILYRRYLKRGDVYVYADLEGATSVIIKNKSSMMDSPIPPSTLSQGGTMAVATSNAWESKAIMAPWWVNAEQVTKLSPTGEYLTTGSFIIKGHKNFLPPAQLLLGFGVMFRINEESKARHLRHRLRDEDSETGNDVVPMEQQDIVAADGQDEDDEVNQSEDDPKDDHISMLEDANGQDSSKPEFQVVDRDSDHSDEEKEEAHYTNPLQSSSRRVTADDEESEIFPAEEAIPEPNSNNDEPSNENLEQVEGHKNGTPLIEANSTANPEIPKSSGIRHLSARERRLLRKAATPTSTTPSVISTNPPSEDDSPSSTPALGASSTTASPQTTSTTNPKPSQKVPTRGKRHKQNQKYAHQDEADRALALRLLGSTTSSSKAASAASSAADHAAFLAAQKERRREQHLKAQQAGLQDEEIRRWNLAEGLDVETPNDPDEAAETALLENYVGVPLPGDEILDALVVCAPWDAVGARLRWRVKVQPGTVKKGKAVREILGGWGVEIAEREKRSKPGVGEEGEKEAKLLRREGELIKGLREAEVVGLVPVGRCRVVMGGGERRGAGVGGKSKRGGRGSKKGK